MAYTGTIAARADSNVSPILKTIFDTEARSVLPNEWVFWKYVKQSGQGKYKLDGESFTIEVQLTRNDTSRNTTELGVLPAAKTPKFATAKVQPVRVFQPIQVGHELVMLADRDVATFAVRAEQLYTDAKNAVLKQLNRQSIGDGTGVLTTVTGTLTSGSATGALAVADSKFFEEGAEYDIWNATTTMRNTAPVRFVCNSVDSATQVTVSMSDASNVPSGVVANDVVIRAGHAYVDTTRKCLEMNGLQSITADADFMGLAKTNRRWNAVRIDAGSQPIGPRLLGRAQIAMRRASASAGKITTIWMSPEQSLDTIYGGNGTYPDVRFSRDDARKIGAAGQNRPTFNFDGRDLEVNTDLDLPLTKAIMFNEEALGIGQLHDLKYEDFDGRTSLPVVDITSSLAGIVPADVSWLAWRGNAFCFARNEFVEVYGLPTPTN